MMRTRILGLAVAALLIFSGTAHAAGFNAAELQAILDGAEKAAPAGSAVLPSSKPPAPWVAATPTAQATGELGGYVGSGSLYLGSREGHLFWVSVAQSKTPALAKTAWRATEETATGITYSPGTDKPTNFKNRKIKGHTVTFSDQSIGATVNGQPETQKRAFAAVVVGRHLLNFAVDDPDAATAKTNVERWITRSLR